jgi:SAM-dependent methyltransferase
MNMVPKDFNPPVSHPLYFIRKGLFNKISLYSSQLNGRLLDFGCGAKPYQSLFNHVTEYIGLDYISEGHSHENEHVDVFYDGKTIPFPNESFDAIFSSEVFEHVFSLQEILPEISRVLKKGGKILLTCPFVWEEHEVPIDYARYTQFALHDMLRKNGFAIISTDKNGHFIQALYQMYIVYIHDFWLHKVVFFSKFEFFKKCVRQIFVPFSNYCFLFFERFWPKSKKLYLNTIIVAQKV